MAAPKNTAAPGPDVVEALANPMAAGFMRAVLTEAKTALREKYDAAGNALSPTAQYGLTALDALGEQLITATTPAPGGEK